MKKLIIIPAYNEAENIEKTVNEIIEKAPGFDYVVIDDCSADDTRKICIENGYNMIHLPFNLGIGGAVQTGYRYGLQEGYDIAVQVDGDGQHDPAFLNMMAEEMKKRKLDMIIGSRFITGEGFQSSGVRRVGIRYFTFLIRLLTGKRISDPTSGLRMINWEIMKIFAGDYPKDYPEPESVVAVLRQKKAVGEIPVIMKERGGGISSISLKRSVYYMVKVTLAILIERVRK